MTDGCVSNSCSKRLSNSLCPNGLHSCPLRSQAMKRCAETLKGCSPPTSPARRSRNCGRLRPNPCLAELRGASSTMRLDNPTSLGLTAGSRLGNYDVIAPLGAGGMGEVYRARDAASGATSRSKSCPRRSRRHQSGSRDSSVKRVCWPRSTIRILPASTGL